MAIAKGPGYAVSESGSVAAALHISATETSGGMKLHFVTVFDA